MTEKILKLHGKVQHYAWGGYEFIPGLLGIQKEEGKPYAEYWMGAHPSASSEVVSEGKNELLYDLILKNPGIYIGDDVYIKFGELPYLFKVLDVRDMLSIQVHPCREEAIKGYEAEEAAGVPIDAAHRNYKDKNHKPEVMVALGDFWLLHGFKMEGLLRKTLSEVPELNFLLPVFEQGGYYGLYREAMEMSQEKTDEVLSPLVTRAIAENNTATRDQPGYWVKKLYAGGGEIKNIDKGIFSIYFFNIVHVARGEAVFQGAGIPHAYLEGQNMELMANSDNVLRGGLTPKHIDVPELLKHTLFEGIIPDILRGDRVSSTEKTYPCPVDDFAISVIELQTGNVYDHLSSSPEIYIVIEGATMTDTDQHYIRGDSFFVVPGAAFSLTAQSRTLIYKAFLNK